MKKNISILTKYDIFSGLSNDEMESILMRLNSKRISFDKDDPILLTGDPAGKAGIVLSGKVRIVMEDYYGNRSITSQVTDGEMFAEVFACSDIPHMPVSVFAAERSEILLINLRKLSEWEDHAADQMLSNLLRIVSSKTLMLNQKINILSKRSTREKLLAYFSVMARQAGSPKFTIPFNRQELADFLCVDRSAMSSELSRMAKDGLIICKKNEFELL